MNKDCNQCKGSGLVADLPAFPKPAWADYESRPRGGPDPMTDFVMPVPCPTCFPKIEDQVAELRRLKDEASLNQDFERAAHIRDQIEEMTSDSAVDWKDDPSLKCKRCGEVTTAVSGLCGGCSGSPCEVVVVTLAQGLRAKAVGYRKRAETLEGLATVAEGLTPGSAAEKAFVDFVKTQGVDL